MEQNNEIKMLSSAVMMADDLPCGGQNIFQTKTKEKWHRDHDSCTLSSTSTNTRLVQVSSDQRTNTSALVFMHVTGKANVLRLIHKATIHQVLQHVGRQVSSHRQL